MPSTEIFRIRNCIHITVILYFNRDQSREFGIPMSSFSPYAHENPFRKEFFDGNLPLIPPNIIISWVRSVSTNSCNWYNLDQDNN